MASWCHFCKFRCSHVYSIGPRAGGLLHRLNQVPPLAEHVSFFFLTKEPQHPLVMPGEQFTDYLPRTEQYWVRLARDDAGPDAKEKRVLKIAHVMAKTFFDDSA